ncbi:MULTISPECIES: penicillin-binding protein activator [Pseudomonas]|uniref:penicillin-binding protein activator n=1 Tax=Pseudomonas TaxID=286 RepID=UPI001C803E98|nr:MULTISPECIES: penicillin-binding protein activator [Pseudomonas]MDG9929895.1 penicillin-binding protein activator [Pseudomonas sp. GD04042]MDH0485054.1 penicillin-binding protein activator [Pseudomonas sp. GD04015]MDH0606382.1 penicillin-binding protein activator [Pseudomonas sp. GD03869]
MIACLRPLSALCLAGLLVACGSTPSNSLGELPRTPQASIDQLLQQASQSKPEQAAVLRLSAAEQAYRQQDFGRATRILGEIPRDSLKPAQQVFAATLEAELAMARNKPKSALKALQHPSLERLGELPVEQQIRTQLVRARALEADGQALAAARERVFIAPLLSGDAATANHEAIWSLVSSLPKSQLVGSGDSDLDGWISLALASKSAGTPDQQLAAIEQWKSQHPQHPAAEQLPQPLSKLKELAGQPLQKIALLLPHEGQLASVARALRDGFLAAHYQAQQAGENPPEILLYDSSRLSSLDDFYRQAQADGAQLVVGPLEKPLVKQLSERPQLPLTTLALNYSDAGREAPAQLFQFGLAAEDEAREVARRAWADGMRSAVALVPSGEWGNRVLAAFQQSWQAAGGNLIAAEHVDQPVELARQIADLLQLRQSEARAKRLQSTLGTQLAALPARRQDIDFIFLAATPQQAQQIKPTLAFQYAGDLPVYATSHLYTGGQNPAQYRDLEGIRFCETPWLLEANDPLRQQVDQQWPQAAGSLGRLYAMGVDAFRLAPRLGQLQALPDSQVEGLSGNLTLNQSQRIERQLPWAEFRNGQVQRLPDTFN